MSVKSMNQIDIDAITDEPAPSVKALSDQTYDALLDLILANKLKAGDLIRERWLAGQLGVSRTPLRNALHRLEGEQIFIRRDANKLYVREVTIEEFMEVLYMRRLLETDIAARAASRIDRHALAGIRDRLEKLLNDGDPTVPDHIQTDEDLHELIAEAAGNKLIAETVANLKRRTRMFSMKRMPERHGPICREHLMIVDALASGDGAAAAQAVADHLDAVKISILNKLADT